MPYKKSNKQIQEQRLGPLKKKIKDLALNKEIDNDSESGGYTGQPKQHGSPFEMRAKRYNNSPMQKNFGDSLAITKKLDKDNMVGGLTGQPSGETGKIGSGPFKKTKSNVKPTTTPKSKGSAKPIKFGDPSNKMRQRFQTNIKNIGPSLQSTGKDIKYKLSGKTGRTKMATDGYKTPKQRRKPGIGYSISNPDKKFKTLNPKFQSVATGPQTAATAKLNKKSSPSTYQAFSGEKGDPYKYRYEKGSSKKSGTSIGTYQFMKSGDKDWTTAKQGVQGKASKGWGRYNPIVKLYKKRKKEGFFKK